MGRKLRMTVPTTMEQLKPQLSNFKKVKKKDRELKTTQKRNYNGRHRTSEQAISEAGDEVWITDKNENGEVEDMVGPRSYTVRIHTGTARRNRLHLNRLPSTQEQDNCSGDKETAPPNTFLETSSIIPVTPQRSSKVT